MTDITAPTISAENLFCNLANHAFSYNNFDICLLEKLDAPSNSSLTTLSRLINKDINNLLEISKLEETKLNYDIKINNQDHKEANLEWLPSIDLKSTSQNQHKNYTTAFYYEILKSLLGTEYKELQFFSLYEYQGMSYENE